MQIQFLAVHEIVILSWALSEFPPVRSRCLCPWQAELPMPQHCSLLLLMLSPYPRKGNSLTASLPPLAFSCCLISWRMVSRTVPALLMSPSNPKPSSYIASCVTSDSLIYAVHNSGLFSFLKETDMVWGLKYYSCVFCISIGSTWWALWKMWEDKDSKLEAEMNMRSGIPSLWLHPSA